MKYLIPHTTEWFAALGSSEPEKAAITKQIMIMAGRADTCSVCGDPKPTDYKLLGVTFTPVIGASYRLCDECRDMQQGDDDSFVPMTKLVFRFKTGNCLWVDDSGGDPSLHLPRNDDPIQSIQGDCQKLYEHLQKAETVLADDARDLAKEIAKELKLIEARLPQEQRPLEIEISKQFMESLELKEQRLSVPEWIRRFGA